MFSLDAVQLIMAALSGMLGAILGSFIATVIVRWPRRAALAGRSRCDGCSEIIAARHLVPLVSYVRQSARAHCCGHPIDPIHPQAELLALLLGGMSFVLLGPDGWSAALLGWLLLALALFDLRHFTLPDWLNAMLLLSGLATALIVHGGFEDRLIGTVAGYASLTGLRLAYRWLRKREGMGGGDPKMLGAIGAWVGWQALPIVLLGAALTGLVAIILLRLSGRAVTATTRLPLGTLMAAAAWPVYVALAF